MESLEKQVKNIQKNRLLILASGKGTLFNSILRACKTGQLKAKVSALVSNKSSSPVLEKAKKENIPVKILDQSKFSGFEEWDKALCGFAKSQNPNLIVLAGFFRKIGPKVLSAFENRVLSIHPSLLPKYGGLGMYGINVHRAVIEKKEKISGASVHLVHAEYDTGPVLAQTTVPVSPGESPKSLQEKVKKAEQILYVSTLQKILTGAIKL